jgi:hypothetical protein
MVGYSRASRPGRRLGGLFYALANPQQEGVRKTS